MRSLTLTLLLTVGLAVAGQAQTPPGSSTADKDPAYFFLLGRHLEGEGKVDEAIAAHKQAIALAPKSAELRAELAGLYARTDKGQEAIETAQAAIALDPNNREANKILGTIYAALSEQRQAIAPGDNPADYPARAIAALEKARRDDTFDINLDLMLGRLYAQTGAFEKALPLLRHVVDDQPRYQEGALLLAAAQESAGKPDDAIETLARDAAASIPTSIAVSFGSPRPPSAPGSGPKRPPALEARAARSTRATPRSFRGARSP